MEVAEGIHRYETPFAGRVNAVHLLVGPRATMLVDTAVRDTAGGMGDYVDSHGLARANVRYVLNTHCDWDHTGGNLPLKQEFGAMIIGPAKDRDRIPGIDVAVDESAPWRFGEHIARILEIPAHTRAHIAFAFEEDNIVFTGDTLFAMGCGRLFEGTPQMMWTSLSKLMRLSDEMRVYCGHEYTLTLLS